MSFSFTHYFRIYLLPLALKRLVRYRNSLGRVGKWSSSRVGKMVIVQPYVTKLQWLTAETQRAQREDNFSFAVEKTAKENYSAALLHYNLTLMHYYSLLYHYEVLQNLPGWFLLFSVLSTESNKKIISASSAS